jgi:hypothetical protein
MKTIYGNCVAEAAALYKSRKDAAKSICSVWGILSNAIDCNIHLHI